MMRPRARMLSLIVLLGSAFGLAGCQNMGGPNWLHPGSADVQQRRAIRYDPYPQPDFGPTMDGARPRNYDKPLAEAERSRWYLGDWDTQGAQAK